MSSTLGKDDYVQGTLKWLIVITAALGAMLEVIDTSIVNVAITSIQSSLGATISEVGWVVSGYSIANVILIPLSAWLGFYFGRKSYFIFSLVGFTVASILCGFSVNLAMLVVCRILQGLFGGGLLAKGQSIIFETFPPHEQGLAQAMFGVGVIAGPAIGPTLGGYLTDSLGWRADVKPQAPGGARPDLEILGSRPKIACCCQCERMACLPAMCSNSTSGTGWLKR